ncbi:hypothetical protein EJB05_51696 [Eragrostis curvula]|uniref:Uncharacterized protein n=1 Tax=Eragrostis curvula TaxID=38414 RepID=A0A5J9SUW0_9POAL|nr:hypothetical protein EJB05_51696 [Eragrostis curvula]
MPCSACGCACGAVAEAEGEALREEELDAPLLDLETGPGQNHAPPPEITGKPDGERALERAAWRIVKCTLRACEPYLKRCMPSLINFSSQYTEQTKRNSRDETEEQNRGTVEMKQSKTKGQWR